MSDIYSGVADKKGSLEAISLAEMYKERMDELLGIKEEDTWWTLTSTGFKLAGLPWIGLGIDAIGTIKNSNEIAAVDANFDQNDYRYTKPTALDDYETGLMDAKTEMQISLMTSFAANAANTYDTTGGITGEQGIGSEIEKIGTTVQSVADNTSVSFNWSNQDPTNNPYNQGTWRGRNT